MISLFSSTEEDNPRDISKKELDNEWRNFYDQMYQDIRDKSQTINVTAKPNIDGMNIPSADHTRSDLVQLKNDIKRIEDDLVDFYSEEMVEKEVILCRYCIHSLSILIDLLDINNQ